MPADSLLQGINDYRKRKDFWNQSSSNRTCSSRSYCSYSSRIQIIFAAQQLSVEFELFLSDGKQKTASQCAIDAYRPRKCSRWKGSSRFTCCTWSDLNLFDVVDYYNKSCGGMNIALERERRVFGSWYCTERIGCYQTTLKSIYVLLCLLNFIFRRDKTVFIHFPRQTHEH